MNGPPHLCRMGKEGAAAGDGEFTPAARRKIIWIRNFRFKTVKQV